MKKQPAARHFPYKHPTFGRAKAEPDSNWKNTVYFYWWEYLKRNTLYRQACESRGAGPCADLYKDFGDVRGADFKAWWTEDGRGVRLFAEPRAEDMVRVLEEGDAALSRQEALTISLPLSFPKRLLEKRIKELLAQHHTGARGKQYAKHSMALYKVKGQPNVPALATGLMVFDLHMAHPELTLWEIGNRMPRLLGNQKIKPSDSTAEVLDKRRVLSASVSRYLKRVRASIQRAGEGVFP